MTARNQNTFDFEEFREDGKMILFVLSIVTLFLSFYAPFIIAQYFGYTDSMPRLSNWLQTLKIGWRIAYMIIHMSVGLLMIISVATIIFTLAKLLITGLFNASTWLIEFITTTIETIINLIVRFIGSIMRATINIALSPMRFTARTVYIAITHAQKKQQTEQEIRRLYEEEHFEYFINYRAFRNYIDAIECGEEPPQPRKQKAVDPFIKALALFDLKEPFTKEQFKSRYRQLIMQHHPDLTGSDLAAQELNAARTIIKDRKGWR